MSTRVLNSVMMTEISRNLSVIVMSGVNVFSNSTNNNSKNSSTRNSFNNARDNMRVSPTQAALARVRRDLFGPVDHAEARALVERELKAQALFDSERWGFDFKLEIPNNNSRFEWEFVSSEDVVPEPYAFRGMPYLRQSSLANNSRHTMKAYRSPNIRHNKSEVVEHSFSSIDKQSSSTERTIPQETHVHISSKSIPDMKFRSIASSVTSFETKLPTLSTIKRQASITDFLKSRRRSTNKFCQKFTSQSSRKSDIISHMQS